MLQNLRKTLKKSTGRDATLIPTFEFALQKYDLNGAASATSSLRTFFFYFATSIIFVMLSWAGFLLLLADFDSSTGSVMRFVLAGLPADTGDYQLITKAVVAFSFLGAYIWSIQYLIRRIANFDLSPMSFLRTSAQIILGCATAIVLRHLVAGAAEGDWTGPVVLLGAFLIGFFPNAGIDYLMRRVPQLRLKQIDPDASAALRAMPVEMIDGIDSQVSFRLAEREILDIENLATENPVLLCAETPYPLLEVLDWIAQAQLALEVGPKAYKQLRDTGIRTIFALEAVRGDPQLEASALKVLYPQDSDRPKNLERRLAAMKAQLHVKRLYEVWAVTTEALCAGTRAPEAESATRTSSSIVPPGRPAGAIAALVVGWKQPPTAVPPMELLMAALDVAQKDALKDVQEESLAAKLSEWVTKLCEAGAVADNTAGFVAEVVNTPWVLSEQPLLESRSLLAAAKDGAEAALGGYPSQKGKDPAASGDAVAETPLLVISRRQGLVLCGVAQHLQRALDDGLQDRLLRLMGERMPEPARTPEPAH
jgi:hypothetical protein